MIYLLTICLLAVLPIFQEAPPQEAKPDVMEEVQKAVEKVRTDFLNAVKEIDAEEPNREAQLSLANALVESMDELLAKLPESEGGGGSSQSKPSQSKTKPEDIPDGNEPADRPKPKNSGGEENPDAKGEGSQQAAALFTTPPAGSGWGQLPPRLQQTLQGAAASDLPLRYRHALERYHINRQR